MTLRTFTQEQLDTIWNELQSYDKGQSIGAITPDLNDSAMYGEDFPELAGVDFTPQQLDLLAQHEIIFALGETKYKQ